MDIHERKYFRFVFRKVISVYHRKRESGSLGLNLTGPSTHPLQPLPCDIDFIADIEKAAKAALTAEEHRAFTAMYTHKREAYAEKLENSVGVDRFRQWKHSIQEKLGIEFVSRQIHPVEEYLFLPVSKGHGYQQCSCRDKSHQAGKGSDLLCKGGCGRNMAHHPVGTRVNDARVLSLWCRVCSEDSGYGH